MAKSAVQLLYGPVLVRTLFDRLCSYQVLYSHQKPAARARVSHCLAVCKAWTLYYVTLLFALLAIAR